MAEPAGRAVIVAAARTAIGSFGGTLKEMGAPQLGAVVIADILARSGVEPEAVGEVILGNVYQCAGGPNPARVAAVAAGIPYSVPAMTVNKLCGSGLKAIALAAQAIGCGEAGILVAGGMESMSRAPFLLQEARWGRKLGHGQLVDSLIQNGLWDCFYDCHMGMTAENLACRYAISREEQDRYAARSQQRAQAALQRGFFVEQIAPVPVPRARGEAFLFAEDEHPRAGVTPESLAGLRPAFKQDGTVTAGNASGINDGAAAVLLMDADLALAHGLRPLAAVRAWSTVGVDPGIMGIGPAFAIRALLRKTGLALSDIDLLEVNEAFAAQTLAVGRELGWDEDLVNVNGGAIALGHPLGCSGARIVVGLLDEMARRDSRRGIAALCIGGGMGIAMLLERE